MRYASFKHFIDVSRSHKRSNAIFLSYLVYLNQKTQNRGFRCDVSLRCGSHSVVHLFLDLTYQYQKVHCSWIYVTSKFGHEFRLLQFSAALYCFLSQIQSFVFLNFHLHFCKFEMVSKADDLETCSSIRRGLTGTKVPCLVHSFKRRCTNATRGTKPCILKILHAIFDI